MFMHLQPVVGWVLFNIYEGAKNQVDNMRLR
jgi:Photosystem II protein Y (PsbY)